MNRFLLFLVYCGFAFQTNQCVAQNNSISVMTYNIRLDIRSDSLNRWDYRKAPLIKQIKTTNPDILGVQEALPHQVKDLQNGMEGYRKVGLGREENFEGEASCIYVKTLRFIVKDTGTFWLSATPEKISRGWDAACNRVCSYVHLEDRQTGKRFWVFNTHWDHIGEKARDESLRLTLSRMKQLNPQNEPMVYMGDFNCTPEHERWKSLNAEWEDTFQNKNPKNTTGTFNGFQSQPPATARIDYIWVTSSHFQIRDSQILTERPHNQWLSDHYPVISTIEFIL